MRLRSLIISFFCTLLLYYGCAKNDAAVHELSKEVVLSSKTFTVSNVLSSNMVIQRDKPFMIWGSAPTGDKVTVTASWEPAAVTVTTDTSGNWKVIIPAAPANASPQTITSSVNGLSAIKLSNILIGDVWLCSGQSNMVMPLDSVAPFPGFEGVTNYKFEIAAANYPDIRVATVRPDSSTQAAETLTYPLNWSVCSPATAATYSAVAYYFAQKLNTSLNVPIGLVISAVNGTPAECWVSEGALQANSLLNGYYTSYYNAILYNRMIYPLRNLSLKGFLWYQGESNRADNPVSNYTVLNSALIDNWRTIFNQGTLPFYFVQVAPYDQNYSTSPSYIADTTADDYAFFREAQANVRSVASTGFAVTIDVGDIIRIHPKNKKPVGERLALLALKNTYGQSVQCLGPQYSSYIQSGNTATVNFVNGTATGLNTVNNAPMAQCFFVAGTDHVFRQGKAVINGSQVMVTAPAATPLPIQAVRFAFTDFPITNLQNSAGLPMEPFRTDNWSN